CCSYAGSYTTYIV
nr:immunoglobulin light chain junction region [Macaca mulatta]